MRKTCPSCNHGLTIREAIQKFCRRCMPTPRRRHTSTSSSIQSNFDDLISEELKKRTSKSAA